MTGPASSISDETVKKALETFVDSERWDSTGWLPNMRRALEAVAEDMHAAVERDIRERLANDPASGWPC